MNTKDSNQNGLPNVNSETNPSQSPTFSQANQVKTSKTHLVILIFVLLVFISGVSYFLYKNDSTKQVTVDVTLPLEEKPFVPIMDSYYLAEYDGVTSILYFDDGRNINGYVTTNRLGMPGVDVSRVKNPVLIIDNKDKKYHTPSPTGFVVDANRENIYMSLLYSRNPLVFGDDVNEVVRINLLTKELRVIHRHVLGDNTYPQKGTLYLQGLANDWLMLSPAYCNNCDGGISQDIVLVHTNTGQFKNLGPVGNVKIDGNIVSYQNLATYQVPCDVPEEERGEVGPCSSGDTTKSVWVPEGPVIETDLTTAVPIIVES